MLFLSIGFLNICLFQFNHVRTLLFIKSVQLKLFLSFLLLKPAILITFCCKTIRDMSNINLCDISLILFWWVFLFENKLINPCRQFFVWKWFKRTFVRVKSSYLPVCKLNNINSLQNLNHLRNGWMDEIFDLLFWKQIIRTQNFKIN
jgi:hypothetical protein